MRRKITFYFANYFWVCLDPGIDDSKERATKSFCGVVPRLILIDMYILYIEKLPSISKGER